jgi:hypothetical protein
MIKKIMVISVCENRCVSSWVGTENIVRNADLFASFFGSTRWQTD